MQDLIMQSINIKLLFLQYKVIFNSVIVDDKICIYESNTVFFNMWMDKEKSLIKS